MPRHCGVLWSQTVSLWSTSLVDIARHSLRSVANSVLSTFTRWRHRLHCQLLARLFSYLFFTVACFWQFILRLISLCRVNQHGVWISIAWVCTAGLFPTRFCPYVCLSVKVVIHGEMIHEVEFGLYRIAYARCLRAELNPWRQILRFCVYEFARRRREAPPVECIW